MILLLLDALFQLRKLCLGFLGGGIAGNGFVALVIGVALLIGAVAVLTVKYGKRQAK